MLADDTRGRDRRRRPTDSLTLPRPRILHELCEVAADRRERDLHTAVDTLRNSLGFGGDVATRDNTPRDTVSHSTLRLRPGVHESGRPE